MGLIQLNMTNDILVIMILPFLGFGGLYLLLMIDHIIAKSTGLFALGLAVYLIFFRN